jgi:hypothetical protein
MNLSYPICPNYNTSTGISAEVRSVDFGDIQKDANVFATIQKPDSTTEDVNFTNDLSGTYTYNYTFDQNGTYLIQAHAFKSPNVTGDINGYVYVTDLNWTTKFLNNGFDINIGELGTIRNTVTNIDGNTVYDINANTTIYYPNGTVADGNSTMSQLPNGEFVRSFFGPSPAGVYTVSSIFVCGSLYDHNGAGTFTVNETAAGGGSDDSGDSGGTSTGGGTSSGGGSGGGGGASSGKQAQILGIEFIPILSKGAPSRMNVTVQNLTRAIRDYVVNYSITPPTGGVTTGKKQVMAVSPYTPTTVTAANYLPLEKGTYQITAELQSSNGFILYDTYQLEIEVSGEHLINVDVQPASTKTALGLSFPFTINLLNSGDFREENIQIKWFATDSKGEEYVRSSFSTSLNAGESNSFPYSPFVPLNSTTGMHELTVEITAYGVTQTKVISFDVSTPNEYYAQLISDLELRIGQLDDKIDDLQQRGFDVAEEKIMLVDIQLDLAKAKGMFLAGNFENLNILLLDLSARVTRLAAMVDALEQQAPLLSREGLMMLLYAGGVILLLLFIWLLLWFLDKEKKEKKKKKGRKPVPVLWPGLVPLLDLKTCYLSKKKRKLLKRKPLISKLLGLNRGEEE